MMLVSGMCPRMPEISSSSKPIDRGFFMYTVLVHVYMFESLVMFLMKKTHVFAIDCKLLFV
jgi:hypothetical protein